MLRRRRKSTKDGEACGQGKTILFISSYSPELVLSVCGSIGVMARGRLREIREAADWTEGDK